MGKQGSASFKFDRKASKFFDELEKRMPLAREKATDAMGTVWADGAKSITQADDHIDTGAYINSIGYDSNTPGKDGSIQKGDVFKETVNVSNKTILTIGSNVKYASPLEKRYNIMARALDESEDRMVEVGTEVIKKIVLGK